MSRQSQSGSSHQQKVEAGRKGGEARHASSQGSGQSSNQNRGDRHEAAIKAAETRKQNDPQAFQKMGSEGGKAAHH